MSASLSDDEIEDRFFILSRMEIMSVLNDLIHRREPVTVRFNGGRDFFLTTLLEARPEALIFDLGGDLHTNELLPKAPSSVFIARPEGVRIQFSVAAAHRFSWGGSDAFWVPLPDKVVRMQRRESFRVQLPVAHPLVLELRTDASAKGITLPAHDISVGGIGLGVRGSLALEAGQALPLVRCSLPRGQVIECAAVVRHLTPLSSGRDGPVSRLGLSFSDLPRSVEVSIQRHIVEIEHERRELLGY